MSSDAQAKILPAVSGALVGVMVFAGLSIWWGRDFIPTVEQLPTYPKPVPPDLYHSAAATAAGPSDPGQATFESVCATCHQKDAKGLAGTFPPLAGSTWVDQDSETPIRIVIMGLGGAIEVNGTKFNSLMPPPPGVSDNDEKIAQVLTYVRSHFGNKGAAITKDQVAAVRATLGGRAKTWTADELNAMRPAAGGAAPAPAPEAPAPEAVPAPAPDKAPKKPGKAAKAAAAPK